MLKNLSFRNVIPVDQRAVAEYGGYYGLEESYLESLPFFHGGEPNKAFFTTPRGDVKRIAWFTTILDFDSFLPPPFIPGYYHRDEDYRIIDQSMPYIISDTLSPYVCGERIIPIAAISLDVRPYVNLRYYASDLQVDDSLCLDRSTTPHSIVLCHGELAKAEAYRCEFEDGDWDDFQYPIELVCNSLGEFWDMLREETA